MRRLIGMLGLVGVLGASAAPAAPTVFARDEPTRAVTPAAGPIGPAADAADRASRASTVLPSLFGLLDGIVPESNGDGYGLVVEDLGSGARAAVNDQQVFPSASLYKLGVAWLVLRRAQSGALSLEDALPIEPDDAVEPEPRGGVAVGQVPTVRDALGAMLSVSSNAAAHALLRVVGRGDYNREMQTIGLTQTRVPDDAEADDADAMAVTSPADIARLLRLMATTDLLSAASRDELWQWLARRAPPDPLRDALPTAVDVVDKTGNLMDASNVGALLQSGRGTVILVVIDSGVDPREARGVIAQVGDVTYQALLQPPN